MIFWNSLAFSMIQQMLAIWTRFVTLYRRQGARPSPRKRNAKAKCLSEEALQIAEKREAKDKGEKERYTHLNAEFQIARRHQKASLLQQRNRRKQ